MQNFCPTIGNKLEGKFTHKNIHVPGDVQKVPSNILQFEELVGAYYEAIAPGPVSVIKNGYLFYSRESFMAEYGCSSTGLSKTNRHLDL